MHLDKAWFSEQVLANEAGMYALAMSYMKQDADARDCMQQSILKAYERLDSLREPEKFKTWMFSILINCCKDALRERNRSVSLEDRTVEEAEPPAAVSPDTRAVLWSAVQRLPEPSRTILILFYYEDLATADIAESMGEKPATVRKQLERARIALRQELEQEGFSYDG